MTNDGFNSVPEKKTRKPRQPKIYQLPVETLDNEHVQVRYERLKKQLTAYDKDDRNNEPALYTTSKRGLEPVFQMLKAAWADDTTFRGVQSALSAGDVRYHYWCRMD